MRAWDDSDPAAAAARRAREHDRTLEDLQRAGVDLDPVGRRTESGAGDDPGAHEHPAPGHPHEHADGRTHSHPHRHGRPGEPPLTGIVGAGAVGTALGVALTRGGWPVAAIASRDPARRERARALLPGARAFSEANAILDEAELIILAVPDDAIAPLAAGLRLYSGQALVHTSGLLGAEVLAPAMAAGTQIGSFHPLVAFADLERAVAALHGATIAVEGDEDLVGLLADMAEAVGGTAVRLAPGAKPAYHAAAVLAAGGMVALLDAIVRLGAVAGLDEHAALGVYLPLVRQTLANAETLGVAQALTGPFTRGDVGTLDAHLDALRRHAPDVAELYRALGSRELAIARRRGSLAPDGARRLAASLAKQA
jgi:predicted short-subunit dehydrogenase-like oxidoreductase (DUF2520 family)